MPKTHNFSCSVINFILPHEVKRRELNKFRVGGWGGNGVGGWN